MGIHVKTTNGWEELGATIYVEPPPPGLPGVGTSWASIESVAGDPKRYAYKDGDVDWVAYSWTNPSNTNTVTTTDGLIDVLLVGGGGSTGGTGGGSNYGGGAGAFVRGITNIPDGNHAITIGRGGAPTGGGAYNYGNRGTASYIQNSKSTMLSAWGGGGSSAYHNGSPGGSNAQTGAGDNAFIPLQGTSGGGASNVDNITGADVVYCKSGHAINKDNNVANSGNGGGSGGVRSGSTGVVIIRVPKEFDNVFSRQWTVSSNHFAVVENGVVTETYTENYYGDGTISSLPKAELIPCDVDVVKGYIYENGEFVPPLPDPVSVEDVIAELQAQIDTLRKA